MPLAPMLRTTPGKLYVHIASVIRRRIENGDWKPGDQIPTISSLAKQLDVAIVSVRQALDLLEQDGLLRRQQGKGTFVEESAAIKQIWLEMDSTWGALVKKWEGISPTILAAHDHVVDVPLRPGEGFPIGPYHFMRRLHAFEGAPYAIVNIYLDMAIYEWAPDRFDAERVVPIIQAMDDVEIGAATEVLSVAEAEANTADLLGIRLHSPIAEVRRVVKNREGFVIFLAECVYRGDMVKLERRFVI